MLSASICNGTGHNFCKHRLQKMSWKFFKSTVDIITHKVKTEENSSYYSWSLWLSWLGRQFTMRSWVQVPVLTFVLFLYMESMTVIFGVFQGKINWSQIPSNTKANASDHFFTPNWLQISNVMPWEIIFLKAMTSELIALKKKVKMSVKTWSRFLPSKFRVEISNSVRTREFRPCNYIISLS